MVDPNSYGPTARSVGGSLFRKTGKEVPFKVGVPFPSKLEALWDDSCFSFIGNFNLIS